MGDLRQWTETTTQAGVDDYTVIDNFDDGSSQTQETVTQADGSSVQTWSKSDGTSGSQSYDSATGENIATQTSADGTTRRWDTKTLDGGAVDEDKSGANPDGTSWDDDVVTQADGSTTETWRNTDGSSGQRNVNAQTGEVTGTETIPAQNYSHSWDIVPESDGSTDMHQTENLPDGTTRITDRVTQADGSYDEQWSLSTGDSGTNTYVASTGEVSSSKAYAGSGSDSWDSVTLADGSVETKTSTYDASGQGYAADTLTYADGSDVRYRVFQDGTTDLYYEGSGADGQSHDFKFDDGFEFGHISGSTASDTISFGSGITRDQLWFSQNGNDLDVTVLGSGGDLVVKDWYASSQPDLQGFQLADGESLSATDVQSLVSAMAAFDAPASSQASYTPAESQALQPVLAANWHG